MLKNKISWTKSLVFVFLLSILLSGYAYIHFRFITGSSFGLRDNLPTNVQTTIDSAVNRMPVVVGIQIVKVDLQKNVRYISYSSLQNAAIKKIYSNFIADNITAEVPAFTRNQVQNSRMLSLINHEFICYPFTDTLFYELLPELNKHIKTVCSTTIPVEPGKFVGFVAVFLSREPTDIERDLIRIESIIISTQAYEAIK